MYKVVEYEDWNTVRRIKSKKRIVKRSENEFDTYYEENDRER